MGWQLVRRRKRCGRCRRPRGPVCGGSPRRSPAASAGWSTGCGTGWGTVWGPLPAGSDKPS